MSSKTKAVVKFTYEPRLEDELGLTKGDFVYVVEKSTDGWWKGEAPNGGVGWFPSNYVEEVEASTNGNQGSIENRNPAAAAVPAPIMMQAPPPKLQASRSSFEVGFTPMQFNNHFHRFRSSLHCTRSTHHHLKNYRSKKENGSKSWIIQNMTPIGGWRATPVEPQGLCQEITLR